MAAVARACAAEGCQRRRGQAARPRRVSAQDKVAVMAAVTERAPPCYCSFCGKSQHEVDVLLAGALLTFICDECVALAVETVALKRKEKRLLEAVARCAGCTPDPVKSVASA